MVSSTAVRGLGRVLVAWTAGDDDAPAEASANFCWAAGSLFLSGWLAFAIFR